KAGPLAAAGLVAVAAPVGLLGGATAAGSPGDPALADAVRFADLVLREAGAARSDLLWPQAALARAWRQVAAAASASTGALTATVAGASAADGWPPRPAGPPQRAVSAAPGGPQLIGPLAACAGIGRPPPAADAAVAAVLVPLKLPTAANALHAHGVQAIEL